MGCLPSSLRRFVDHVETLRTMKIGPQAVTGWPYIARFRITQLKKRFSAQREVSGGDRTERERRRTRDSSVRAQAPY